jgi:hypothetical protein
VWSSGVGRTLPRFARRPAATAGITGVHPRPSRRTRSARPPGRC